MKILVAMDSFKGSLSSLEAGHAVREGILKADPAAQVIVKPLADGGEGTVSALTAGLGGRIARVPVTNPVGKQIKAEYGILPDKETAVMEMSQACGLTLINDQERNPLYTTTYGVGEMILDAIRKGVRNYIIGIGGSATNDGGIGMLQALGFGVLDQSGKEVPFGARGLESIAKITNDSAVKELTECTFRIACDVSNPLFGDNGASHIFGPQKGADPSMIVKMDKWMKHYAEAAKVYNPDADPMIPGTGAAGGLGFAFLTFTNASLESGIKIVLEETKFEDSVKHADVVVTGEGRLDGQSAMGKAPVGVSEIAKKYGKSVIVFSGCVSPDARICNSRGIDAYFPILQSPVTLSEAMDPGNASQNLLRTAEQVFRLIHAISGRCKDNALSKQM